MKLSQEPCRHGKRPWHAYYMWYCISLQWIVYGNDRVCYTSVIDMHEVFWTCLTTLPRQKDLSNTFSLIHCQQEQCSIRSLLPHGSMVGKTQAQVNQFLHSWTRPSKAHLILKRCTLRACLSRKCQSRCQRTRWTILTATDDRWWGLRGAGWVHVKGCAGSCLGQQGVAMALLWKQGQSKRYFVMDVDRWST